MYILRDEAHWVLIIAALTAGVIIIWNKIFAAVPIAESVVIDDVGCISDV